MISNRYVGNNAIHVAVNKFGECFSHIAQLLAYCLDDEDRHTSCLSDRDQTIIV